MRKQTEAELLNVWPFAQRERQIEWEREKAPWWNWFVGAWLPTICWFSIWCALCAILTAHTRPYNTVHTLKKHTYSTHSAAFHAPIPPHAHTCKCIIMGTDTHLKWGFTHLHTEMHRNMHAVHRQETWHSLPWLQTQWMNHPEICPFCPKLLASKSYSAVKSRQQNPWIMWHYVSMTCHTKDKGITQQTLWKNILSQNDKHIGPISPSHFTFYNKI